MVEKKISIIIPVYKVEQYLDDCVKSIISQTYQNLEIILVDDGSPDNCPNICDKWAKNDNKIKVIHKKNGGLSSARNAGLDVMTGDYVMFVDSDDTIHSQACEILLNNIEIADADISMSSYRDVFELKNLKEKRYNLNKITNQIYENDEIYDLLFNKKVPMIMVACMKLYKRDIFKNLRFEEKKLHEDEFIIHKTLNGCNRFVYCNLPLYNYLQRRSSIVNSSFNKNRLQILEALEDRIIFTKNNKPKYEKNAILQYMRICILCYYRSKWSNLELLLQEEIKSKIENYYTKGYKNFIVKMFYKHPVLMEKIVYLREKMKKK